MSKAIEEKKIENYDQKTCMIFQFILEIYAYRQK